MQHHQGNRTGAHFNLALRQRLRDIEGLTLIDLLAGHQRFVAPSPRLRRLLEVGGLGEAAADHAEQATHLASGMVQFLTKQFQYVDLRGQIASLEQLYQRFLNQLVQCDPAHALARHQARLKGWTVAQLQKVDGLRLLETAGEGPVCAHYSPQTQLEILGLTAHELLSPILDLGCGDGSLIKHLIAFGHSGTGIDRTAPQGFLRGDWFDAPLGSEAWGTIIAHQSLSLHFRYAHIQSEQRAAEYAGLFMRVLGFLKPGGSFVYAPGLPFIEDLLPAEFQVVRHSAFPGASSTRIIRISRSAREPFRPWS